MKKSLHSLLTAAMFAAAVTTSAGSVANAPNASAAPAENDLITETTTEPQCVYGPPEWFTSESELTDITGTEPQDVYGLPNWFSETETLSTDVTRDVPPTVYGPPSWFSDKETEATTTETTDVTNNIPDPVYGPPWARGDLNHDFRLSAEDLTLLKRELLKNKGTVSLISEPGFVVAGNIVQGDLNGDQTVNRADVELLIRQLTGKPDDEEEPDVTTTATEKTEVTTNTTTALPWNFTVPDYDVPLYGPPSVFEKL